MGASAVSLCDMVNMEQASHVALDTASAIWQMDASIPCVRWQSPAAG